MSESQRRILTVHEAEVRIQDIRNTSYHDMGCTFEKNSRRVSFSSPASGRRYRPKLSSGRIWIKLYGLRTRFARLIWGKTIWQKFGRVRVEPVLPSKRYRLSIVPLDLKKGRTIPLRCRIEFICSLPDNIDRH